MGRPAQLFVQSCKFQKDQNAYFILVFPKILIIVNSAAGLQIQRCDVLCVSPQDYSPIPCNFSRYLFVTLANLPN
jgi:hypothetical protein